MSLKTQLIFACLFVMNFVCSGCLAEEVIHREQLEHPSDYWKRNAYLPLFPSIRFPTNPDQTDVIEVFIKLPDELLIDVKKVDWYDSLVFPSGTRIDRVEWKRINDILTVIDVRGTEILSDGSQRFHVLRPLGGQPDAKLAGFSWPAQLSSSKRREINSEMCSFAAQTWIPGHDRPLTSDEVYALIKENDCQRCHAANRYHQYWMEADSKPHRNTDTNGFYTPLSVLVDEGPMPETRMHDLNITDPYCTFRCADGSIPKRTKQQMSFTPLQCDDQSVAIVRRDIFTGIKERDYYTLRVCASRRYLYNHMTDAAKEIFQASLKSCEIQP